MNSATATIFQLDLSYFDFQRKAFFVSSEAVLQIPSCFQAFTMFNTPSIYSSRDQHDGVRGYIRI